MFGTVNETYTTPGITSDLSSARQTGPLQLVTTDANGNLAADGGDAFKAIAANQAGIAIALSLQAPSLTTGEKFGLRLGYGSFAGNSSAFGLSAIGVLCQGCFTRNDRLALDGGIGVGSSSYKTYDQTNVTAGRVGVQWTWK